MFEADRQNFAFAAREFSARFWRGPQEEGGPSQTPLAPFFPDVTPKSIRVDSVHFDVQ